MFKFGENDNGDNFNLKKYFTGGMTKSIKVIDLKIRYKPILKY